VSPDAIVSDADGTLLAIRRLRAELLNDPYFQRRFPVEVNALRDLDEPWLAAPTSYLLDGTGRVVAILRRHVPGIRLSSFLEHHPRGLDAQTTTVIAIDVLTALSALHARGVGHRAVTAENIVIDADGTCVLVDIGLVPRAAADSLESTVVNDLTWFADLVARCLAGRPVGRRRRQAPLIVGAWLPTTVPEPLRSLLRRTLDPARGAASTAVAATALADLSVSAVQLFDADWDIRARERLLNASCEDPGAEIGVRAGAPVSGPPTSHRRTLDRRQLGRRLYRGSIAFGVLGASAALGVSIALTSGSDGPPAMTQVMTYTTPTGSTPAAVSSSPRVTATAATASPTPAGGPTNPTPSASAPSAPAPPATPTSAAPSASSSTSRAPATTTVTRVAIVKFIYTGFLRSEALLVIKVHTSGTGPVSLLLTFAGSDQRGAAGASSPLTVSYTLEGQYSYLVAYRVFDIEYCDTEFWGVTVGTSPAAPATAYAQLPAAFCWGSDIKSRLDE
jgi:serine/threonine-protein kinase